MIKTATTILICLILLTACEASFKGVCRHNALYTASIMAEKYPTVIVVGDVAGGPTHAQTKSYINGKWEWIVKVDGGAQVGQREEPLMQPYEYDLMGFADLLSRLHVKGE